MSIFIIICLIAHLALAFPVLLVGVRTNNLLHVICCLVPIVGPIAVLAANHKPTANISRNAPQQRPSSVTAF